LPIAEEDGIGIKITIRMSNVCWRCAMAAGHAMDAEKVMETYFLETRAKLLEIAANLDRVDRAGGLPGSDSRIVFIREALAILQGAGQVEGIGRAERIQRLYSKT